MVGRKDPNFKFQYFLGFSAKMNNFWNTKIFVSIYLGSPLNWTILDFKGLFKVKVQNGILLGRGSSRVY